MHRIYWFGIAIISQLTKSGIVAEVSTEQTAINGTDVVASETDRLFPYLLIAYVLIIVISLVIYYYISKNTTDIQQFIVLLLTGLSNVVTGIILFEVNQSNAFKQFDGLLILVQPLMGLKGNLEMTMASRMSTAMNVREDLISFNMIFKEIVLDICLVQSQATVVAFVTSLFAIIGLLSESQSFDSYNAIKICAISLLTANTACLILGTIVSLVIIVSKKLDYDPDDFATPLAASLGDLGTLLIMIFFVFVISHFSGRTGFPTISLMSIAILFMLEPILLFFSFENHKTRQILIHGWTPIIIASLISSFSGVIFTHSSDRYPKLPIFQPLFNGFAGNCTALLASRISTSLHRLGPIGTISKKFRTVVTPTYVLCSEDNSNARTTITLMSIVVPSHLLYVLLTATVQKPNEFKLTMAFLSLYLTLALIQITILLYLTYSFSHLLWRLQYDPDIYVIPIMTAVADITGTVILFSIYYILELLNDPNAKIKPN